MLELIFSHIKRQLLKVMFESIIVGYFEAVSLK